jgi:hypothetical protein
LRDLNHTATEHLRRQQLAEQTRLTEERANIVAKLRSRLEWLEVFTVGFLAIAIIDAITRRVDLGNTLEDALLLLGGPVALGVVASILKPWKRKAAAAERPIDPPDWILIAVILACVAAWLAGLLGIWTK